MWLTPHKTRVTLLSTKLTDFKKTFQEKIWFVEAHVYVSEDVICGYGG